MNIIEKLGFTALAFGILLVVFDFTMDMINASYKIEYTGRHFQYNGIDYRVGYVSWSFTGFYVTAYESNGEYRYVRMSQFEEAVKTEAKKIIWNVPEDHIKYEDPK